MVRTLRGLVLGLLGIFLIDSAPAEFLKNGDIKDGKVRWKGDGKLVYLKPDGSEGGPTDAGAIPALKIDLNRKEAKSVFQEFDTKEKPKTLQVKVDYLASPGFKRSAEESLYNISWTSGTYYWTGIVVPQADFWVRAGPGWLYHMGTAGPSWKTLDGKFSDVTPAEKHVVHFCVPPGEGAIYIRNASVIP